MYPRQRAAGRHLQFLDTKMPIFDKSDLAIILTHGLDHEAAIAYLEKIKWRLAQEILRCISECPPQHLAHLACGTQPLGVSFSANNTDFKVIFMNDGLGGLYDPWDRRALDHVNLPELTSLSESGDAAEVVEMAVEIADISQYQRARLEAFSDLGTFNESPNVGYLELLMFNPRVTERLRAQVLERMSSEYLPQLAESLPEIYLTLQERLDDDRCEQERRAALNKRGTTPRE